MDEKRFTDLSFHTEDSASNNLRPKTSKTILVKKN